MTLDDALAALAGLSGSIGTVAAEISTLKQQIVSLNQQVLLLQANQADPTKVDQIVSQLQALNVRLAGM